MFETDKRCRRIRGKKRAVEQKKDTKNKFHLPFNLSSSALAITIPSCSIFFPLPPYNAILCVICHNHLAALSLLYFFVPLTPSTLIMLFRTTHHSSSSPNSKHQVIFFSFLLTPVCTSTIQMAQSVFCAFFMLSLLPTLKGTKKNRMKRKE